MMKPTTPSKNLHHHHHHHHHQQHTSSQHGNNPYSFPILKSSMLLRCMNEIGLEMTESELLEPHKHKERVREVFEGVLKLQMLFEFTDEDLYTPLCDFSDAEHPGLFDEAGTEMRLWTAARRLMVACGVRDFGLRDLAQPQARRLQRQLSGVINLCKFCHEKRASLYEDLAEGRDHLVGRLREVVAEHERLAARAEEARTAAEGRRDEARAAEAECLEIEREIKRRNETQAAIREETDALKRRANDLKTAERTARLSSRQAETRERTLRRELSTDDPAVVRRERELAERALRRARDGYEEVRTRKQREERRVAAAREALADLTVCANALTNDLEHLAKDERDSAARKEKAASAVRDAENLRSDLDHRRRRLAREIRQAREKRSLHEDRSRRRVDGLERDLEAAQAELAEVERGRKEALSRVEEAERMARAVQESIDRDREEAERERDEMVEEYKEFERKVLEKERALAEYLDGVTTSMTTTTMVSTSTSDS